MALRHGQLSVFRKLTSSLVSRTTYRCASTIRDPFAPSTTTPSVSSPAASQRPVTIPPLQEIHDPEFLDKLLSPPPASVQSPVNVQSNKSNLFLDALSDAYTPDKRILTENGAVALASSGSACLDVFSGLNAQTPNHEVEAMLSASWKENPLSTLRLIWHLRSIHHGQSANKMFYRAYAWLYEHHPRTAIANLPLLVLPVIELPPAPAKDKSDDASKDNATAASAKENDEIAALRRRRSHGYFKDLLHILLLATNGELSSTANMHSIAVPRPVGTGNRRHRHRSNQDPTTRLARIQAGIVHNQAAKKAAAYRRLAQQQERSARVFRLLTTDKRYRALYVAVVRIFAESLASDLRTLRRIASPHLSTEEQLLLSFQISLAAKWAPSIGGVHDRHMNIATAIAQCLYDQGHLHWPVTALSSPVTTEEAHRVRGMYQRWTLSPLRRFTHVIETYMSAGRWKEIPYHRVPSKCMSMNSPSFNNHDAERFGEYLKQVAQGKQTISGATLLPHELLIAATRPLPDLERGVVNAQWNSMVQSVRDAGVLDNCLAVCDVSGSMGLFQIQQPNDLIDGKGRIIKRRIRGVGSDGEHVEPIFPALALTIVLAQTAREPWRNQFITFSQNPRLVKIDPAGGLADMASTIDATEWAMNTNYTAVFLNLILPTAIAHKLPPSEMVKRLFVFSDMEWDSSRSPDSQTQSWETEHEIIKAAFEKAGYQLPEIVFWNLQGGRHGRVPRPVDKHEAGTALVTGFSPNMMKLFMEGKDLLPETDDTVPDEETPTTAPQKKSEKPRRTPLEVMNAALGQPSFAGLHVVD